MAFLAAGLVIAESGGKGGSRGKAKPECKDSIDNDGSGYIDLADVGYDNKRDNDETNCRDTICEGDETSQSCSFDCGLINSYNHTDAGWQPFMQGIVSGYQNGKSFGYTDICLNATNILRE